MAPTDPPEAPETGPLTARQRRIVDFIATTVRERGYPPTVREIGEAVGLDLVLERPRAAREPRAPGAPDQGPDQAEGHDPVRRQPRRGRRRPARRSDRRRNARLAEQNVEDHLVVPMGFAGDAEHFALTVTGDSMVDAGILDGDVVIVRGQDTADDGDVVAVLLPGPAEDEATVKRLRRQRGKVMLVPENPAMDAVRDGP